MSGEDRETGKPRRSSLSSSSAPKPPPPGPGWFERLIGGSVSSGQLAGFCRQAASYLNSGVSMDKALSSLQTQFQKTGLGPPLERITQAVRGGDTLTEAFGREPQVFDSFFLSLLSVAETRGGVPETLKALSKHYESRQRLIKQARSALIYPIAVLVIAAGVIWLLTVFVLPKLIELLADLPGGGRGGANLPASTRALITLSRFMGSFGWWLLPLAAIGGLFAMARFYRTRPGRELLDRAMLWVPVLGPLLRHIDAARFARSLSALLDGGVGVDRSLKLSSEVMRLSPLRKAVADARAEVRSGSDLTTALGRSRPFPPEVQAVVETGEETGSLPEALDRAAVVLEEEIEHRVKNLGSLIQPLLLIIVGGFVFFVVVAFISAYAAAIAGLSAA
jgi:type II secretory pathway component PulF